MKGDEIIKLGEGFSRLMSSPDYELLAEFINGRIQTISTQILQTRFDRMDDLRYLQGQLIGLAMGESYMVDIINRMKKVKEKRRNEQRRNPRKTK